MKGLGFDGPFVDVGIFEGRFRALYSRKPVEEKVDETCQGPSGGVDGIRGGKLGEWRCVL